LKHFYSPSELQLLQNYHPFPNRETGVATNSCHIVGGVQLNKLIYYRYQLRGGS